MTYEDLLVAIDATAPQMGNCALRLLLRLIAIAINQGSSQVRASDRWIGSQLGFSKDGITAAKRGLAGIVQVQAAHGSVTTFNLPADWFAPQRSLFSAETALVNRAPRPGEQGQTALVNGAPVPFLAGRTALIDRAPRPGEQGTSPDEQGGLPFLAGRTALVDRAPATQNQQDTGAPSISKSISEVSNPVREYVFSIFSMRVLTADKKPAAAQLAGKLQDLMHRWGKVEIAQNLPDDIVLTQCLEIATLKEILNALERAKTRKPRPRGYMYFVTLLLEELKGIKRDVTAQLRDEYREMRKPKPPGRETTLPFPDQLLQKGVAGLKRME